MKQDEIQVFCNENLLTSVQKSSQQFGEISHVPDKGIRKNHKSCFKCSLVVGCQGLGYILHW